MNTGRIGARVVGQGMRRMVVALLAVVLVVGVGAAPGHHQSARPAASSGPDLCAGTAPIPAGELAHGQAAGCSLTGRTVVDGAVSVQVPPPGITVAADGLSGSGESPALVVSNRDGVLYTGAAVASGAGAASTGTTAAKLPADCSSTSYVLENGGHPWRTTITWKLRGASVPKRMQVGTVLSRLKDAFGAWRYDRNDCHYTGQPKRLREAYAGGTTTATGIAVRNGKLTCGSYNQTNTVELGPLPGSLLGWTCYWWSNSGAMVAFDTRLENGTEMVTSLPSSCHSKWDLQSIATHEFGHAIGLGHVGNGTQTMHGVAPACSTAPRTIGRGDRRGLMALYGMT